ncbi:VanZ family protein [Pseudoalteromonas denitrificans]|uniref:VanZ like family protein n=1 Tax=Pseudoalteromonas denitrificans DSM 6059 TaxID=1123010 RepID=A0A1I1J4J7_9GAMM|nr:VanZ family protein [Pseudoalteromonas denitrificans]SFC43497.1 VanZ like family protein [Pseudoalteromonas denitrificans DSM 6059]
MTRRLYKVLFLSILIICTVLFAKEVKGIAQLFPHIDKIAHFGIFFILAGVMQRAFKAPTWIHILLLISYGAGIEIMQSILPHRDGSFADLIADAFGVAFYFSSFWLWQKNAKKAI